jgi:hypothetical protein
MPRTLFALLLLALSLALVGCPTGTDDDDSGDDDDAVADDDDAGDDDDAAPVGPFITGTVEDPAGNLLEGIALTLCDENRCLSGQTQAGGAFQFSAVPDGEYVVHNLNVPGIADGIEALLGWSSFYDIVTMAGADVDLPDAFVVPEVTDTHVVADGVNSLDFGGELTVSWDGILAVPFALADVDPITVGAVKLDPSQYPAAATAMGYEVLAGWALTPFEVALEGDLHFSVEVLAPGLTGADTALLYADYDVDIATGMLSMSAAATPDDQWLEGEVSHLGLLLAVQAL